MFSECSNTPHNRDTNKKLVKIIHSLLENEQSSAFRKPVPHKALGLGDYKKIVKKPIDLNQIRRQNNQSRYKTIEQALDDIELCWDNCKLYNHASSQVYQQAISLQKLFWKMVQDNFPQIYAATQNRIKNLQINQSSNNYDRHHNSHKNNDQIYEMSEQQAEMKDEKDEEGNSNKLGEAQAGQSRNSKMEDDNIDSANLQNNDNRSQRSQLKELPKEPIEVSLKQKPSAENIAKLTNHMKSIQQNAIFQQVLQILFTYQKQNMIAGTKGQMHFKMSNIHLSTFYRICKVVKLEFQQNLQIIQ